MAVDPLVAELAAARTTRRWSQDGLSDAIGVAKNSLSRWETGASTPGLAMLRAWAGALGYDLVLVKRGK